MHCLRMLGTILHRPLVPVAKPGWKCTAAICLLLAALGTWIVDWLGRTRVGPPSEPVPNTAHLMELMASGALAGDRGEVADWKELMSKRIAVGIPAPDFSALSIQSPGEVALRQFRGRPVVLVFGSFSCDRFCTRIAELERLYQANSNRAAFLFVNVTEAGHRIPRLEFVIAPGAEAGRIPVPERRRRIAQAMRATSLSMPAAVDANGVAEKAYHAFPMRIVAVSADGAIGLDLGRGLLNESWDLAAIDQWLAANP